MQGLMTHNPKFASRLATLDTLRRLPEPAARGRLHKPVPHAVLVDAIREECSRRNYTIAREQLALSKTNAALFGVLDLELDTNAVQAGPNRGIAFGFRNAVDQQFGIRAVAGTRVFVCDNLALSGDLIAISRKNRRLFT